MNSKKKTSSTSIGRCVIDGSLSGGVAKDKIRRKILIGAIHGAPIIWSAPILTSVILPVHAQTSIPEPEPVVGASAQPASQDLGSVILGERQTGELTITNTGEFPVEINAINSSNSGVTFTPAGLPVSIAIGASTSISFETSCGSGGSYSTSLSFIALSNGLPLNINTVDVVGNCETSITFSSPTSGEAYVIPEGITSVSVIALGASGEGGMQNGVSAAGGEGGRSEATFSVTQGETLTVIVGSAGGGGAKGSGGNAGAGGGSSAVERMGLPLIVAGAGGGAGSTNGKCGGGAGGGASGSNGGNSGGNSGGKGGSGGNGGAGGTSVISNAGTAGTATSGGNGGSGSNGGGGGGDGYGGGGGGSAGGGIGGACGGGGGGYAPGGTTTVGGNIGNGSVVINFL